MNLPAKTESQDGPEVKAARDAFRMANWFEKRARRFLTRLYIIVGKLRRN